MKKAAIWGAATCGKMVYQYLNISKEIQVVNFVDKDKTKQNGLLYGLQIISPDELMEMVTHGKINVVIFAFHDAYFKEATALFRYCSGIEGYIVPKYAQVRAQMKACGRVESCYLDKSLIKVDLSKPRIKQIETSIVEHCNLKCKGCSHFSNLIDEPIYADYDTVIADWKEVKRLFWGVERLKILGGEPLLSPDLCKYIRSARDIFQDADIMVTTNALLINETCEELFQVMREAYCRFDISLYASMEQKIKHIEKILQDNHVWYSINYSKSNFTKRMSLDPVSDNDEIFMQCYSKNCHQLGNGKITVCPIPAYLHVLNNKFHLEIPDSEGVWEISKEKDGWELDRKLNQGFETCKYCVSPVEFKWGRADSKTARLQDWIV